MGKNANHDVSQWLMGVFFVAALGVAAWEDKGGAQRTREAAERLAPMQLTQPEAFAARTIAKAP